VISKDEADYRDIFIMNPAYRIGAKFVEDVNRRLRRHNNLVEAPDKMTKFVDLVVRAEQIAKEHRGYRPVYFNSDCSRWGPNHMPCFFYAVQAMLLVGLVGVLALIRYALEQTHRKIVQNPRNLVQYLATRKEENANQAIKKFTAYANDNFGGPNHPWRMPEGMGQGVYHNTSSTTGSLSAEHVDDMLVRYSAPGGKFELAGIIFAMSITTSDDLFRAMVAASAIHAAKINRELSKRTARLSNIIISPHKSTSSLVQAEVNSVHINRDPMVTVNPVVKQRAMS